MKSELATLCVATALLLDTLSYWRQIKKILRTKKSGQVSTTSFLYKIAKEPIAITGLLLCTNYVGALMGGFMLIVYIVSLIVIIKYKPKNWHF